jgi:hypothetical protein
LAAKKPMSTRRKTPLTKNAVGADQPQRSRMTLYSNAVVSSMVVETAVP